MDVVTADWEARALEEVVASFVTGWACVHRAAWLVRNWPRRLGGEATAAELALDKKLANKVGALAVSQVRRWGGPEERWGVLGTGFYAEAEASERRDAAVLNWYEWMPAQLVQCSEDGRALKAWCGKNKVRLSAVKSGIWALKDAERTLSRVCEFMALRNPDESVSLLAAVESVREQNLVSRWMA